MKNTLTAPNYLVELNSTAKPQLLSVPEDRASLKPYSDKWSIKEILVMISRAVIVYE